MVLLDAARRGVRAHPLAWAALGLGIAATVAANVAAGLASGPVGAIAPSRRTASAPASRKGAG